MKLTINFLIVHALAVGRTLVAIIENFYDGKNTIHVPKSLQKYLNKEVIACN